MNKFECPKFLPRRGELIHVLVKEYMNQIAESFKGWVNKSEENIEDHVHWPVANSPIKWITQYGRLLGIMDCSCGKKIYCHEFKEWSAP